MYNRILLIGKVQTSPTKVMIKDKEEWFLQLKTVVHVPKGDDDFYTFTDVFRIKLIAKWQIANFKNLQKGDLIEVIGRASVLPKIIKTKVGGKTKSRRYNDTTIIPEVIREVSKDMTDGAKAYTDYLRENKEVTGREFKIPKQ